MARLVPGVPAREQHDWAHGRRLGDPTTWLAGGELVLTTGIGAPRAVGEQRAYVEACPEFRVEGFASALACDTP